MTKEGGPALTPLELATQEAAEQREQAVARAQRKQLGVVHTPPVLVRFALARIEHALQHDLGLVSGLSERSLTLLDPALGTGVWLSSVLARLEAGEGPQLLGFETDPEALATARSLLEKPARARGVRLTLREANTLAIADPWPRDEGPRVVLGNPPWGARSLSRGLALSDEWLREFYREPDGSALRERRSGVLSDDYVRFLRWALEQARTAPAGAVVAFVTNDSYLEGPVHRGMRAALVRAFDRIELVDLGGGSLRSRGGSVDEPLFPVKVGAVLALFVRTPRMESGHTLSFARLSGTREAKHAALRAGSPSSQVFETCAPWFRFRPQPRSRRAAVGSFSLGEAFVFHAEGVQTNRDAIATAPCAASLRERLMRIVRGELNLTASRHFDVAATRARLSRALAEDAPGLIEKLAYRPFDTRVYCTLPPLCHRPRADLLRAAQASPLCLVSTRKEPGEAAWNMFGVLSHLTVDSSFLSVRSSCRTRLFPSHAPDGSPNVSGAVSRAFRERLGFEPSAEEVVAYIAGVLGAPSYRAAQGAALRLDYAEVPLPVDRPGFEACARAGRAFGSVLQDAEPTPDAGAPHVTLLSACSSEQPVARRTLRRLAPDVLELAPGVQIGVRQARALDACVGHHPLVLSAYTLHESPTIGLVLRACERASLWVDAENAADVAYRAASCVGGDANGVAAHD